MHAALVSPHMKPLGPNEIRAILRSCALHPSRACACRSRAAVTAMCASPMRTRSKSSPEAATCRRGSRRCSALGPPISAARLTAGRDALDTWERDFESSDARAHRARNLALRVGFGGLGWPSYINLGHAEDLMAAAPAALCSHAAGCSLERRCALLRRRSYGLARSSCSPGSWRARSTRARWSSARKSGPVRRRQATAGHEIRIIRSRHCSAGRERGDLARQLDLYQSALGDTGSRVLEDAAVLDELHRLRRAGWHGLTAAARSKRKSCFGRLQRRPMASRCSTPCKRPGTSWSRRRRPFAMARERGIGVIVKEPLAKTGRRNRDQRAPKPRRASSAWHSTTSTRWRWRRRSGSPGRRRPARRDARRHQSNLRALFSEPDHERREARSADVLGRTLLGRAARQRGIEAAGSGIDETPGSARWGSPGNVYWMACSVVAATSCTVPGSRLRARDGRRRVSNRHPQLVGGEK